MPKTASLSLFSKDQILPLGTQAFPTEEMGGQKGTEHL
jgi:hypothetical protein